MQQLSVPVSYWNALKRMQDSLNRNVGKVKGRVHVLYSGTPLQNDSSMMACFIRSIREFGPVYNLIKVMLMLLH